LPFTPFKKELILDDNPLQLLNSSFAFATGLLQLRRLHLSTTISPIAKLEVGTFRPLESLTWLKLSPTTLPTAASSALVCDLIRPLSSLQGLELVFNSAIDHHFKDGIHSNASDDISLCSSNTNWPAAQQQLSTLSLSGPELNRLRWSSLLDLDKEQLSLHISKVDSFKIDNC